MWRRRLRDLALRGADRRLPLSPGASGWRRDSSPIDLARRPVQGRLGDCWVMAALLAVHEAAPERCAAMVGAPTGGVLEVRLPGGPGAPEACVRVDRMMPVAADGRWIGAHESGAGPGWAGAVEKALAIHVAGSYRVLAHGFGRTGLRLLTGVPVRSFVLRLPDAARIDRWVRAGHAVLASSHPASPLVPTVAGPWPADHVMAVVGAEPASGHVLLRNPWRPEAVLRVDARTFRRAVLCVDVTAVPLR